VTIQYKTHHPNFFNQYTAITTADSDTAVVTAKTDHKIFITDIMVLNKQTAAVGSFTLTKDDGTTLLGPISVVDNVPFSQHFQTPLVNDTKNDQVEFDKTGGEDDWEVYLAGYYAID